MFDRETKTQMALFDRLKKGDERAFSEVYALFAPGLIRYVSQKMGDLTHAQDIFTIFSQSFGISGSRCRSIVRRPPIYTVRH